MVLVLSALKGATRGDAMISAPSRKRVGGGMRWGVSQRAVRHVHAARARLDGLRAQKRVTAIPERAASVGQM